MACKQRKFASGVVPQQHTTEQSFLLTQSHRKPKYVETGFKALRNSEFSFFCCFYKLNECFIHQIWCGILLLHEPENSVVTGFAENAKVRTASGVLLLPVALKSKARKKKKKKSIKGRRSRVDPRRVLPQNSRR